MTYCSSNPVADAHRHYMEEERLYEERCAHHAQMCMINDVEQYMLQHDIVDCEEMPCWDGCPFSHDEKKWGTASPTNCDCCGVLP